MKGAPLWCGMMRLEKDYVQAFSCGIFACSKIYEGSYRTSGAVAWGAVVIPGEDI